MTTANTERPFPSESSRLKIATKQVIHDFVTLESEFINLVSDYLGSRYEEFVSPREFLLPYIILIKSVETNNLLFSNNSGSSAFPCKLKIANDWLDFSVLCRSAEVGEVISRGTFCEKPELLNSNGVVRFPLRNLILRIILKSRFVVQKLLRIRISNLGFFSDVRRIFGIRKLFDPSFLILNDDYDNRCLDEVCRTSIVDRRLNFYASTADGSGYSHLAWVLFFLMPLSTIEGIKHLLQDSNRLLSSHLISSRLKLVSLTSHFSSDVLRMLRFGSKLSDSISEITLDVFQHGGQFGTQEVAITEWMDMYLADVYHVFGNSEFVGYQGGEYTCLIADDLGLGVRSTAVERFNRQVRPHRNYSRQCSNKLVVVLPTAPGPSQHFVTCGLVSSNVVLFYERIAQSLESLNKRWDVAIKVSPKRFGLTFDNFYSAEVLGYSVVSGSVIEAVLGSKIAMITYDGTAALETLATGHPFVWVIDQDFYPLRQSIFPIIEEVMISGIVHLSFCSATRFIENCEDIDNWWNTPMTLESRNFLKLNLGVMLV